MTGDEETPKNEAPEQPSPRIEARRGVPFALFPADRPVAYLHNVDGRLVINAEPSAEIISPEIDVDGISGSFHIPFSSKSYLYPGELRHAIETGRRIVLATSNGPVEVTAGGQISQVEERLQQGSFTELLNASAPDDLPETACPEVRLLLPRLTVINLRESYNDKEYQSALYLRMIEEGGSDIDALLVPTNPEFLHGIQVVVE